MSILGDVASASGVMLVMLLIVGVVKGLTLGEWIIAIVLVLAAGLVGGVARNLGRSWRARGR